VAIFVKLLYDMFASFAAALAFRLFVHRCFMNDCFAWRVAQHEGASTQYTAAAAAAQRRFNSTKHQPLCDQAAHAQLMHSVCVGLYVHAGLQE
jgi:hypothetical protein